MTKPTGRPPVPLLTRISPRLVITECPREFDVEGRPIVGPCLIWTGGLHNGYGSVWVNEEQASRRIHRVMYQIFVGPIVNQLDHLCRVPACASPAHLEDVTQEVNARRSVHPPSTQTHCNRGHEYNETNTRYDQYGGYVQRVCRPCELDRSRVKHRLKRGLPLDMPNRMDPKRATCMNGHPRTDENVYHLKGDRSKPPRCRSCDRESQIRFHSRNPHYKRDRHQKRAKSRVD